MLHEVGRLAENTVRKNYAKNRHLGTIAQLCRAISSQLRHVSTIGKNLLNGNICSICLYNMVNFSPVTAEILLASLGHPSKFQRVRVLASLLQRRRSTKVNQTLYDVWPSPALVYCIRILGSCCPLTELCRLQNSLCVQVLHSVRTRAAAVSQTLWRGTRNGITELSQRAPPIFRWAAITFGIGPHSS